MKEFTTTPLALREANTFVAQHHRHSRPVAGAKFAIGAVKQGTLVGVAISGRPVSRMLDNGRTLEILRVCTDGTKNVNSYLYGRVRAIAALMGYSSVITYTLKQESGASLKAIGARQDLHLRPRPWSRPKRPRKYQPVYSLEKTRWIVAPIKSQT